MSGEDAVYELSIDMPTLPKGAGIQIVGLGTFKNKASYTVSEDEAYRFRTRHAKQTPVHNDEGEVVGSELSLGPTLLEASSSMYGVKVKTVQSKSKPSGGSSGESKSDKDGGDK